MNARVLIVEDDPAVAIMLDAAVRYGGFESHSVGLGADAIAHVRAGGFTTILLDLGLPDYDGTDLLRELRSLTNVPILVVSGHDTEADKIEALDAGADDYIPKPFLPGELLARLRATLRRYGGDGLPGPDGHGEQSLTLGALALHSLYCTLSYRGRDIQLTEAQCRIVIELMRNRTAPVSRGTLQEALYGEGGTREGKVIDVHLVNIRRKLKALTGTSDLLEAYRGRGWVLREP